MVSGPHRPDKPKPPVKIEASYNAVLHQEAPRAQLEQARRQFESALQKAGTRSVENTSRTASWQGPQHSSAHTLHNRADTLVNQRVAATQTSTAPPVNEARHQPGDQKNALSTPSSAASPPLGRLAENKSNLSTEQQANTHSADAAVESADNVDKNDATRKTREQEKLHDPAELNIQVSTVSNELQFDTAGPEQGESITETVELSSPLSLTVKTRADQHEDDREPSDDAQAAAKAPGLESTDSPLAEQSGMTTSAARHTERFETIEKMWNHLAAMDARSGPREWHFQIQNQNSSVVSVSVSAGQQGGWHVTVESDADSEAEAQACLHQLQDKLTSPAGNVESVRLSGRQN